MLAGQGEYASLEDYIARMDESISDFELTLQTGNPVTNVIINDTRRRSLDLGIRFQVDFHYPELGPMTPLTWELREEQAIMTKIRNLPGFYKKNHPKPSAAFKRLCRSRGIKSTTA